MYHGRDSEPANEATFLPCQPRHSPLGEPSQESTARRSRPPPPDVGTHFQPQLLLRIPGARCARRSAGGERLQPSQNWRENEILDLIDLPAAEHQELLVSGVNDLLQIAALSAGYGTLNQSPDIRDRDHGKWNVRRKTEPAISD